MAKKPDFANYPLMFNIIGGAHFSLIMLYSSLTDTLLWTFKVTRTGIVWLYLLQKCPKFIQVSPTSSVFHFSTHLLPENKEVSSIALQTHTHTHIEVIDYNSGEHSSEIHKICMGVVFLPSKLSRETSR